MTVENDSSTACTHAYGPYSSVVISLYNYNFCGYEQGLAAHFSYLSKLAAGQLPPRS